MPRRANTNPNLASCSARRMSIGSVIVTPTPTAGPLIAAMTGLVHSKIRSDTRPPPSRGTPAGVGDVARPARRTSRRRRTRSAPAQNPRPAPVTITARTSSSASTRSNASIISRIIVPVNAFSCLGSVQRDRGDLIVDVVEDLRVLGGCHGVGPYRPVLDVQEATGGGRRADRADDGAEPRMISITTGVGCRRRPRPRNPSRRGTSRTPAVQSVVDEPQPSARDETADHDPGIRPSSMNGNRMNQLVAPTNFITSISRRRREHGRSNRVPDQQHGREQRARSRDTVVCSRRSPSACRAASI